MKGLLLGVALLSIGCGTDKTPTTPTPTPPPTTPVVDPGPVITTITGSVVDTDTGAPLGGISVVTSTSTMITDPAGRFTFRFFGPGGTNFPVRIEGPAIVTRETQFSVTSHAVPPLSVFPRSWDADYYNQLARAGTGRETRAWTRNPVLYIHTVDDQNRALDPQALALAESTIRDTIGLWTGGRLQIASVEYGNEDREGRAGTISMTWGGSNSVDLCGQVTLVGFEGTVIRMDTRTPGCRCAGLAIDPAVVRHELGHALGFTHTNRRDDVMNPTRSGSCAMTLSSREQQYANYMYSRPRGNTPIDNDPFTTVF
jgi:hypothetical protein